MIFSILDRYIGRSILTTSLLVLLTLVALAGIFGFIRELDDVGKGNYTVTNALQYVFLTLPSKAYLLFAPAVLLGSLLGLGALASNSELTVMRAAGISNGRIIRAVLMTGVALMLLIALLGETIMPKAEQIAEEIRLTALEERLSVKGRNGLWIKSGNRYVNISTVMPDFTLLGLNIHEFDGVELARSVSAARAIKTDEPNSRDWLLQEVEMTNFDAANVDISRMDEQLWSDLTAQTESDGVVPNLISVDVLKSLKGSAESLSARNLYDQMQYLKENQLDSRTAELAFWTKKIFIGIMLGIIYVLVNKLLTQLALANGMSPFVSAVLPLVCFLVVAILGIQRSA